jgi:hypothetical protein
MDPAAPSLLDRQLQLKPLNIPPPLMVPKGSVPEAWVVPKIPAPPELKLDMPPISVGYKKPPLLPPTPQLRLDPKLQFTPVDIIPVPRCDPDRKLTWADFPSSNVPGSFGGVTRMVTPQLNVDGNPMFQAQLNQVTKSAVVEKVRHADDRSKNGCAPLVAKCKRDMAKGGTWTTSRPNPDKCPAGINSINTATTVDECETVIGAGCDADAVMDSARLLAHEQLHFDISCTMVGRADDALLARSHTPAVLKKWLNDNLPVLQKKYDDESDHGCKATEQASWEADVAAGLTSVALPPPTPVTP